MTGSISPLWLVAALLACASSANGQYLPQPVSSVATAPYLELDTDRAVPLGGLLGSGDRDHRYTGFYVGLGVGAALGIYALAECAGQSDCAVNPIPFGLLSVAVFSVVGALVGGLFPK